MSILISHILKSKLKILLLVFLLLAIAILMSMLKHWEMGGESWGYWLFTQILKVTGKFVVFDRSPIYTIYLIPFSLFSYPLNVNLEYFVTTLIVSSVLIIFFSQYIGLIYSALAVILWLPFMEVSEPPVQKIALALSCLSVLIRQKLSGKATIIYSYIPLILAYMFRSPYVILLFLYFGWDFFNIIRTKGIKNVKLKRNLLLPAITLTAIAITIIFLALNQSDNKWNNILFTSTKWFPISGKSFTLVQTYNWEYILNKYGTLRNHDFYFTNKELFNGKTDIFGMLSTNSGFVVNTIINHLLDSFKVISRFSMFNDIVWGNPFSLALNILFILIIFFGSFKSIDSPIVKIFIFGNFMMLVISAIVIPSRRYQFPLIPIFIFSAYYYSCQIKLYLTPQLKSRDNTLVRTAILGFGISTLYLLIRLTPESNNIGHLLIRCLSAYFIVAAILFVRKSNSIRLKKYVFSTIKSSFKLILPLMLVFLSNGTESWSVIIQDIRSDLQDNTFTILTNTSNNEQVSMKSSYLSLKRILNNCHGIMALEHAFIGAFYNYPLNNLYDVFEIPPFGNLSQSDYSGLNIKRINCIFASKELSTGIGASTNYQIRYDNFIKPYVSYLTNEGAIKYHIEDYGEVYIINSK